MASLQAWILFKLLLLLLLASASLLSLTQAAKVSDVPKLVELVDELNIPEETNASITCSVGSGQLNGLNYEWFKGKERLSASPNKVRIDIPADNYQSTLRIYDLAPKDSALYTCVAKNRFGQDKISTKLNVKVQLKWIEQPHDTVVPVGQYLHIPCRADGSPEPKVEWRKLTESPGSSQIVSSELRLSPAVQSDAGLYECRAINGVEDELVTRIKLDVLDFRKNQF